MNHLRSTGTNYLEHLIFAGRVGVTLLFRGAVFLLHAVCPIRDIPKRWNLENTAHKLNIWCDLLEERKNK